MSTLAVTNANDNGPGSLRAAIAAASGDDTITFDRHLSGSTIVLTGGELAINKSLDIEGPGSSRLAIDGRGDGRVFHVTTPGASVTIAGLAIHGGRAPIGGAILDEGAALTVVGDELTDNQAVAANLGTTARGGAVVVTGAGASFRVDGSVLAQDAAVGADSPGGGASFAATLGGAAAGGALYAGAGTSLMVSDSVFSGDRALGGAGGPGGSDFSNGVGGEADGGAIAAVSDGTTVSIRDATFDGDQALGGRGGRLLLIRDGRLHAHRRPGHRRRRRRRPRRGRRGRQSGWPRRPRLGRRTLPDRGDDPRWRLGGR